MDALIQELPRMWEARLQSGELTAEEWKTLRDMVELGDTDDVFAAARLLDLEDREVNQDDTFFGF